MTKINFEDAVDNGVKMLPKSTVSSLFPLDTLIKFLPRKIGAESNVDEAIYALAEDDKSKIINSILNWTSAYVDTLNLPIDKTLLLDSLVYSLSNTKDLFVIKPGPNQTAIHKKISSLYYNMLSVHLPANTNKKIQNEILENILYVTNQYKFKPVYMDFTRDITWEKGSFGDKGSCYFSHKATKENYFNCDDFGNTFSRKENYRESLMAMQNAFAIRFFMKKENNAGNFRMDIPGNTNIWYRENDIYFTGIGRCWGILENIEIDNDKKAYVLLLLNAYGLDLDSITRTLKQYTSWNLAMPLIPVWGQARDKIGLSLKHPFTANPIARDMYINKGICSVLTDSKLEPLEDLYLDYSLDSFTGGAKIDISFH